MRGVCGSGDVSGAEWSKEDRCGCDHARCRGGDGRMVDPDGNGYLTRIGDLGERMLQAQNLSEA